MALRTGTRALAWLLPAACEGMWHLQAPACALAALQQQQQHCWREQLRSPWSSRQQRHEFASLAAEPSPAAAVQQAVALPDVYVRLADPIGEQYSVPVKRVFAVVEVGGTQYKVTPNDVIVVEKLSGVDVNDRLELRRVLLLGSQAETVIGRPYVPEAAVTAVVEEQFLDGKVLIFHKRRRKNSRRLRGHRQPLTTLRVLDVHGIAEAEQAPEAVAAAAAGQ